MKQVMRVGSFVGGLIILQGVFGMSQSTIIDNAPYKDRRMALLEGIKHASGEINKENDCIVLWANFAQGTSLFRQESSFYYLTGVQEPGVAVVIDMTGKTTLYIPRYKPERHAWFSMPLQANEKTAEALVVDAIAYAGDECAGYTISPFFPQEEYAHLIEVLSEVVARGGKIFSLLSDNPHVGIEQRVVLNHVAGFIHGLPAAIVDISPLLYAMRRVKDPLEMSAIFQASEITMAAHEAAANALAPEATECEICAAAEGVFCSVGARPAFVSIIASGANGVIVHYEPQSSNRVMQKGDLVIVDIGAEWEHYCADVTRTYPVSGTFTARQKELYELVLETQRHVEKHARPGFWLTNKDNPEKSLTHIARKYLDDHGGYGKYMLHGIGHFMGLDVHDVGDITSPLAEGDVITIEPGIYVPEEGIGIRIEDDYWIGEHGVMCLTDELPKEPADVEAFVQGIYELPEDEGSCCSGECECEHDA